MERLCSPSILRVLKAMLLTLAQGCTEAKLKIYRAAIYQLEANTDELRRIKAEIEKHLEAVDEFLNMNPMFRRIEEADNL